MPHLCRGLNRRGLISEGSADLQCDHRALAGAALVRPDGSGDEVGTHTTFCLARPNNHGKWCVCPHFPVMGLYHSPDQASRRRPRLVRHHRP